MRIQTNNLLHIFSLIFFFSNQNGATKEDAVTPPLSFDSMEVEIGQSDPPDYDSLENDFLKQSPTMV